jgi:hypothetical protein
MAVSDHVGKSHAIGRGDRAAFCQQFTFEFRHRLVSSVGVVVSLVGVISATSQD